MQQADDFWAESAKLYRLVVPLDDAQLARPTAFKGWQVIHIIGHLHIWNDAVLMALQRPDDFAAFTRILAEALGQGRSFREFEAQQLGNIEPRALLQQWHDTGQRVAHAFAEADPKQRIAWVGPPMGARSAITARLMEVWAHGQAIYDLLGVERVNEDYIRNIALLGVNTFGWSFNNRQLEVPEPMPYVELDAPSGEIWRYGEASQQERISGKAEEFCQVTTQTRNIADTQLSVQGDVARQWMAIAQCFAGPPVDPPPQGLRRINRTPAGA